MNRIQKLEKQILKHKALYYQGAPEISDHEFDEMEDELRRLCPESPVLQLIGTIVSNVDKIKHDKKMLSLEKTYSREDLLSWIDDQKVISVFKIDGVSCSLVYQEGRLTVAKTRGDGVFGEDIFPKVLWIDDIPKQVEGKSKFEVRGELYCTEENFFKLSQEMLNKKLERPTSQRNIVSGLMGRKENLELSRFISFFSFDLLSDDFDFRTEEEKLETLEKLGFTIPEFTVHKGKKEIDRVIKSAQEFMSEGEYQIDGLVFTYNDLNIQDELGSTAHHPRYRLSYKFQGVSKETTIQEIEWGVSRNGVLTPVAIVSPVELNCAIVSRVTLHNYGVVKQYELKKGDVIEIIRSGEVIPKFLSVKIPSDNKVVVPTSCPECGTRPIIEQIRLRCPNQSCPGRKISSILNYIHKVGIEDLSDKRLEEMVKKGLVREIDDLYRLTPDKLLTLDKTKEKLASKIFESIQKTKNIDLSTFLAGLGLTGGAFNKCDKIVSSGHNTLEKIKNLKINDLLKVESFAEKSAEEFLASLEKKIPLIENLEDLGVRPTSSQELTSSILSGKKICITGALTMKRSEMEKIIRSHGGTPVSSVGKGTDILITNEKESDSSKFKAAKKHKIPIMDESAFLESIKANR